VAALLSHALDRCRRAAKLGDGGVIVGVSGGKDSLATLDIVCRSGAFSRVEALSMELVPGLESFRRPVERAVARYGVKVHFLPNWDVARKLKHAILRPHILGNNQIKLLRLKDIERALTKRTGIGWFSYGERAADSIVRRLYTRECDGVQADWRRCWPIWDWRIADVRGYLKLRRIPLPKSTRDGRASGGITLGPKSLARMKKEHPNDYRKILEVFPDAEIQIIRLERGDFEKRPAEAEGQEGPEAES
jgi:3'-phosphoadenosine 5'-phosphosulfate sulfotransferase (PAPS reductase)/FAD synthetase